jgi:hypothetical protein
MLMRKHKIFLYLLFLFFLFQSKGFSEGNNVYRELTEKGVVTYEDGCRAISCFTDVDEKDLTFGELVFALKEKGVIGKSWKYKAEKPLTRGEIAYMGCKVLKISGGLTMRVIEATNSFINLISRKLKRKNDFVLPDIGMGKRYAYFEFQDNGLMPGGHKKTVLTGHDLLASMYRIEQNIKEKEMGKKQKAERRKEKEEQKKQEKFNH